MLDLHIRQTRSPGSWRRLALVLASATAVVVVVVSQAGTSGGHGPQSDRTHSSTNLSTAAAANAGSSVLGVQAAPSGNLPGWRQIFREDFATSVPVGQFPGTVYQSTWSVYPDGWRDTSGHGVYMASKVLSVHGGVLDFDLHVVNGTALVAAPVPRLPGAGPQGGITYGRYSVRFMAQPTAGYKAAWLLWPDSGTWPGDGEIDFPEGDLPGTISAFAHFANPQGGQSAFVTGTHWNSWHTATTEWLPGRINFYLDGVLIGTSTHQVPTHAMHWVLQTETALNGTRPSASAVGHVYVDWVVAYARS